MLRLYNGGARVCRVARGEAIEQVGFPGNGLRSETEWRLALRRATARAGLEISVA